MQSKGKIEVMIRELVKIEGTGLRYCHLTGRRSFLGGSDSQESACNAGDPGVMPGLGSSPGEGNGQPLQYSCLENPMDK